MSVRIWTAMAVAAGLIAATGAFAQEEPQVVRQELMKRQGEAMGVLGRTAKGEIEFDSAAVITALETIQEVAVEFPDYFPEGSETGFETEALPAIWEDKADFDAKSAALAEDAAAAIEAAPADVAELQPIMQELGQSCSGCHESYRQSDS